MHAQPATGAQAPRIAKKSIAKDKKIGRTTEQPQMAEQIMCPNNEFIIHLPLAPQFVVVV